MRLTERTTPVTHISKRQNLFGPLVRGSLNGETTSSRRCTPCVQSPSYAASLWRVSTFASVQQATLPRNTDELSRIASSPTSCLLWQLALRLGEMSHHGLRGSTNCFPQAVSQSTHARRDECSPSVTLFRLTTTDVNILVNVLHVRRTCGNLELHRRGNTRDPGDALDLWDPHRFRSSSHCWNWFLVALLGFLPIRRLPAHRHCHLSSPAHEVVSSCHHWNVNRSL